MKTGISITLLICVSAFYSCKKDENSPSGPAAPVSSRYSILTSHYWRFSHGGGIEIYDDNGDSVLDTFITSIPVDSCQVDNRFYFKTNGFFVQDPYLIACSQTIDSITWSLMNNETKIFIDPDTLTLMSVSSSTVIIGRLVSFTVPYYSLRDTVVFIYP